MYGIKIDEALLDDTNVTTPPVLAVEDEDVDSKEPIIEAISTKAEHVNDMLLAKKHTLM
jgi:hypothetical protein